MLQVLVADRQMGKTQAMIEWLLKGKPVDDYPHWSRVIVCCHALEAKRVSMLVREATERWMPDPLSTPHDDFTRARILVNDVRKCVWSMNELSSAVIRTRGAHKDLEVGVDNLDILLGAWLGWKPSFVTMTGELYDATSIPSDPQSSATPR